MNVVVIQSLPSVPSVQQIHALLPQTQCTRCGYPDCLSYAQAIHRGEAAINRCPPGGAQGMQRLAQLTGQAEQPLDPDCGGEGPRHVAAVNEAWCIGCTLCIKACPVDCILGSNKHMHTVIEADCTGCGLCIPVCPVDCIDWIDITPGQVGWAAWSPAEAASALKRYTERNVRRARAQAEHAQRLEAKAHDKLAHLDTLTKANDEAELARKRAVVEAALARARQAREAMGR